jgi:hypothetical protein
VPIEATSSMDSTVDDTQTLKELRHELEDIRRDVEILRRHDALVFVASAGNRIDHQMVLGDRATRRSAREEIGRRIANLDKRISGIEQRRGAKGPLN